MNLKIILREERLQKKLKNCDKKKIQHARKRMKHIKNH